MSCHKTSNLCIILVNGVYCADFLFITDNNKRNRPCHLFNLSNIIRVGITCINNSLRCHCPDHSQIFLLQSGISLRITDKHSVAPLICHSLNPLKKQHIIGTCDGRAKDNNQLFLFVFFFIFVAWQLVTQFSGCIFYFFHSISGKRYIILMVQHHRNRCLGNTRLLCHIE